MSTDRPIGHTLVDQAIELLQFESRRLYGVPLTDEQVEACFDEEQVFPMLDDMEARMGFYVAGARLLLAEHYNEEDGE